MIFPIRYICGLALFLAASLFGSNAEADCDWGDGTSSPGSCDSYFRHNSTPDVVSPRVDEEAIRRNQEAARQRLENVKRSQEQIDKAVSDEFSGRQSSAAQRAQQFESDRDSVILKGESSRLNSDKLKGDTDNGIALKSANADSETRSGHLQKVGGRATNCAPVSDAMIVDACAVPSGLQKGIERAIDVAYGKSPAAVRDRVRKGFQAVMDRDWPVARAWFHDALNRDPKNLALQRLVSLADLPGNEQARDMSKHPELKRHLVLPQDSDVQFLFPGVEDSDARLPKDSDIIFLFPGLDPSGR